MRTGFNFWNVSAFEVSYTNETKGVPDSTQLDPTFVAPTPLSFSFHCYDPAPVQPANSTTNGIAVIFADLQVSCCRVLKHMENFS